MFFPIRIDASSTDKSARLIDSILLDPYCLPIPPAPNLKNDADGNGCDGGLTRSPQILLDQTIKQNAEFLASILLADMEVHGVTKQNKSYIGRTKLLNFPGLKERVLEQIRAQLQTFLSREFDNCGSARRKRLRTERITEKKDDELAEPTSKLIKVRIRIREKKISVTDEFLVDPTLPSSNPITLAQSLAEDLNLPAEMINSIALSISEQICGLNVEENLNGMIMNSFHLKDGDKKYGQNQSSSTADGSRAAKRSVPSAWVVDGKEESIARAHLVAAFNPKDGK